MALLGASVFGARAASAQSSPAQSSPAQTEQKRAAALSWTRAPGAEVCPSGPVIATEVERVLAGRSLVSAAQAEIVVEGRIERGAGGDFESTLTLVSREGAVLGTRRLTTAGPECGAVRGEVGLVIALMIDPDAVLRPGAPAGASSSLPVSPPSPPGSPGAPAAALVPASAPCPPPAPISPPSPPVPWRTQLSVGPVLGLGLLPSPGVGGRFRLAITPPRVFPFELGASLFAPVRVERDGVGLDVFLAQGHVRACPLTGTFGRWGLVACGGVELGGLRGGGFGLSVDLGGDAFQVGAALSGRVQARVADIVVLSAGLDVSVPFVRARFTYAAPDGGRRELFFTSPVAGAADLSLGVEL